MTIKNKLSDFAVYSDQKFGIYRGVVEDRYDPEKLGRCRVRVLGIHDEEKVKDMYMGIPTEELPWAEPCLSLYQGAVSGNGEWCVPLQGTWLWVFFENGNILRPRFFASSPGLPIDPPNPELGFNDPHAEWPDSDWLDEPDWHRYAKRDMLPSTSLLEVKYPSIDDNVSIAIGGSWNEHPPMYQAEYPFNDVKHSHGGIYTEIDNTEGHRRFHLYHPSNSYLEIGEEGNMVFRNEGQRWDIVIEQMYEHIMMDYHRKCDMNRTTLVDMTMWEEIKEYRYTKVHINDRKDVLVDQLYHIFGNNVHYVDGNREKHVGGREFNNVTLTRSRFVGLTESVYIGANSSRYTGGFSSSFVGLDTTRYTGTKDKVYISGNREKFINDDEIMRVDNKRHSYVMVEDLMECDGPIIIKSAVEIILEAPLITFKGGVFQDKMSSTFIAGELLWNGIAMGIAEGSMIAEQIGIPPIYTYVSEANSSPYPPSIPMPVPLVMPPSISPPPAIPVPPPPPEPPELDYPDDPPEPPFCPFP